MTDHSVIVTELAELEHGMWNPATRYDDAWMAQHLHDDFVEFGRSGRRYDRHTIMVGAARPFDADLHDLEVDLVADDAALVTYRSILHLDGEPDQHANRSSTWVRVDGDWRLRFHQGTPIGPGSARS